MPAPDIQYFDSLDTTELTSLAFAPVAGIASAAQEVHAWNDKDGSAGSDTGVDGYLTALSRDYGSGDPFSFDDAAAAFGWLEVRLIGQQGTGVEAQTSGWVKVGKGRYLALKDLPAQCARELEARMVAPAGAGTVHKEVLLRVVYGDALVAVVDAAHFEQGGHGICHGIGDRRFSGLLFGGACTETGTPDDEVQVADLAWELAGVPYVLLAHGEAFTNLDSAAAALASGEAYWAGLTGGAGSLTVTKGVKGAAPLSPSSRPALPEEPFLAWVAVPYGLVITQSLIDQTARRFSRFYYEVDGLDLTLHGGRAVVDVGMIEKTATTVHTLAASSTSTVYLNPNATVEVLTSGLPAQDRALPIWRFVTDGSGVTSVVNLRRWIGAPIELVRLSRAGTLAGGQELHGVLQSGVGGYLMPDGLVAAVGAAGTGSGATTFDVNKSEAGAAFTTIFTSQGTADRRPSIAGAASVPVDVDALPEVLAVGGNARFRADVDAIPASTASVDASLVLPVVIVG